MRPVVDLPAEGLEFWRAPLSQDRVAFNLAEILRVCDVFWLVCGLECSGQCGMTQIMAHQALVLPVILGDDNQGQLDLFGSELQYGFGVAASVAAFHVEVLHSGLIFRAEEEKYRREAGRSFHDVDGVRGLVKAGRCGDWYSCWSTQYCGGQGSGINVDVESTSERWSFSWSPAGIACF